MLVRIDPESEAPLFAQIAASVRADAAAGRVRPGDRLPAARDIAAALGVNVHTVLHAYQDLRDEGLVELRRGRGAVVTAQAATLPATPLALAAHEQVLWMRTTSIAQGAAIAIFAGVLVLAVAAAVAGVTGADPLVVWLLVGCAALLLVLAATTLAFHVRVDDSGLHVDSVLGIPRFHVPLADIESAARVEVNPMGEFGGWGLRLSTGRRFGVVLRAGDAIEVLRRSGKRFVVTVDDAATGAALLEALVSRAASRP